MERAVAEAGPSPRDRLWAYLRSNFQPPVLDPNLLATWISFWSLNKTNPAIAATHAETYGGGRERMEVLLREAAPQIARPEARIAAIALTADRKSGVEGKRGSVRVDLGGSGILKKKKQKR